MLRNHPVIAICAIALASQATPAAHARGVTGGALLQRSSGSDCALSKEDEGWLVRSIEAWRRSIAKVSGARLPSRLRASFYNGTCAASLPDAMALPSGSPIVAHFRRYTGSLTLPGSARTFPAPPGPMSAAFPMEDGSPVFVMSLPSAWRAGGVENKALGLETMMTAVMLHEAAHVTQFATYGEQITGAVAGMKNAGEIDDDTVQKLFGDDPGFAASIAAEQQLFLDAAGAADDVTAKAKVREALRSMDARDSRFLVGDLIGLRRVSDLFWTLEGSGQWIGYRWLIAADGGGAEPTVAQSAFGTRGKWWSQSHGFAMARALDRLDPDWPETAFGSGSATLREMLVCASQERSKPPTAR